MSINNVRRFLAVFDLLKVRTFWEGHKISKNLPLKIWRFWVTSNIRWKIFFKFCALLKKSELYSGHTMKHASKDPWIFFIITFFRIFRPLFFKFMVFQKTKFKPILLSLYTKLDGTFRKVYILHWLKIPYTQLF